MVQRKLQLKPGGETKRFLKTYDEKHNVKVEAIMHISNDREIVEGLQLTDNDRNLVLKCYWSKKPGKNRAVNITRQTTPTSNLLMIDADCFYAATTAAEMFASFREHPDTAVVAGDLAVLNDPRMMFKKMLMLINDLKPVERVFFSDFYIDGGLCIINKNKIPEFPENLMSDDIWLRRYIATNNLAYINCRNAVKVAVGAGNYQDFIGAYSRVLVAEKQVCTLYPMLLTNELSPPILDKSLLKHFSFDQNLQIVKRNALFNFISIFIARMRAKAQWKVIKRNGASTFSRLGSTKGN